MSPEKRESGSAESIDSAVALRSLPQRVGEVSEDKIQRVALQAAVPEYRAYSDSFNM